MQIYEIKCKVMKGILTKNTTLQRMKQLNSIEQLY
jgi:hypothetical protein